MSEITEQTKVLLTLTRHQRLVSHFLRRLARELEARADVHDLSKLQFDEFEGFVRINQVARKHPYGSPEYMQSLKDEQPTLDLHFSRNRHHPEYHPNGVGDMDFIDFVEMVCDWAAASKTYGTTEIDNVLEVQRVRFELSEGQVKDAQLILEMLLEV